MVNGMKKIPKPARVRREEEESAYIPQTDAEKRQRHPFTVVDALQVFSLPKARARWRRVEEGGWVGAETVACSFAPLRHSCFP